MLDTTLSIHDRLRHAITDSIGSLPPTTALDTLPLTDPAAVRRAVAELVSDTGSEPTVVVTGTLDRRLLLIQPDFGQPWTVADLSGRPHRTRAWPDWSTPHLQLADPDTWLTTAHITLEGRNRLLRPRVLLASLYHPENFPLPRFPLAISDLARAARATLLGQVELMDMQLGVELEDILRPVMAGAVDILGVSATFGQHDLMIRLLDTVTTLRRRPLVIAGGSLTARNERLLLDRYPDLIVGRGAGEATIADALAHWHGDLAVHEIRGAGYRGAARGTGALSIGRARQTIQLRHTATVANRVQTDWWPELDLLESTFTHHGVAQLETSRGCTNFCSFCPRGHKGQWAGAVPEALPWLLSAIRTVFDHHPELSRTLYLVDEEFIGRDENAVPRAVAVADTLAEAGFAWETSCRIDQVVRIDRDRAWHSERATLWRDLVQRGLRRCLFGVESGVDSILERFNKETTGAQNALAIRTLTALGVPPRFTYITFDQLMSADELIATYAFQGRTDLLLVPQPQLTPAQIVAGVRDEQWVAAHAVGRPFYTAISYPLVSMECLIGAAYTRQAQVAGLTGEPDPVMGRVQARFADWRIGVLSQWAQRWVDRNFALDYTLKSLEKITDGQPHRVIRGVRRVLKHAAYRLLGIMIELLRTTDADTGTEIELASECERMADATFTQLRHELSGALAAMRPNLAPDHRDLLDQEYRRWAATREWDLINVADPCDT